MKLGVVALGAVVVLECVSCAREPCQKLTGYWGSPEAWRKHEDEPRPRCAAADPSCGPEPASRLDGACYRPSAERRRVPLDTPGKGGQQNPCVHDGECLIAGCGNACVNYERRDLTTTCEDPGYLDEAFCGCVEGQCSFFEQ
jgi:hypothetical protein